MTKIRNQIAIDLFGKRIRLLRQSQQLSMEELAHRAGISYKQLSLVERGINNLTISTILCLADALRVSPGSLFDESDSLQPINSPQPDTSLSTEGNRSE